MKLKFMLATSVVGLTAAVGSTPAFAQSTGSVEFEEGTTIVVTGQRAQDVGGIEIPNTPKAKQELNEEAIRRARPGQTINDIVNLVPGVSFQNNDPWGSSGGSFTIRGFADDRISQTLDGLPLNDSGNYALYTNQQVDPEVLESVSVNLGATDVDSPTAAAVGGTINIRTREPSDFFKITSTLTFGDTFARNDPIGSRPYMRGFLMIDTGDITGFGTKAFASASYTRYDNPFNNYGKVEKQQYNGRIWQDVGSNGDFVAVAGHYNENRPNFFGSLPLRTGATLNPGSAFTDRFPANSAERFYNINFPCVLPRGQQFQGDIGGVSGDVEQYSDSSTNSPAGCGAEFDRRYNPSNTGNIRGSSRFTLADGLVLTVDPSYQYVKANGGGAEDLREAFFNVGGTPITGFLNGGYYYGRDLNGDGDLLDRIAGNDPSQTVTNRIGVIANLAYEISDNHFIRIAYTYDDADHRQTGQTAPMLPNGEPLTVFPVNSPLLTSQSYELNKRDRQSYAVLNQISGEYRGTFFDTFTAVLGLRAPFFRRNLNQNCYTTSENGFLDCIPDSAKAAYEAANPYSFDPATGVVTGSALPQQRIYEYDRLLPNLGFVWELGNASVFGNYAKGLSVPGTDVLYDSLYFPTTADSARPVPETTDTFDMGVRYTTGQIQAQVAGYYTKYENRLASAYDPILDQSITRNLGRVDKYGVDGSIAYAPNRNMLFYVFGSINESEIKANVQDGLCSAGDVMGGYPGCFGLGAPKFLQTAGKNESGAPLWSVGARAQFAFGPVEFGAQVKHTGKRFVNDENVARGPSGFPGGDTGFPASVDGYTLVDLDVRWNIAETPFGDDVAIQLNVTNLFDKFYVGGFGGALSRDDISFVQIGAPRAASISLIFGY